MTAPITRKSLHHVASWQQVCCWILGLAALGGVGQPVYQLYRDSAMLNEATVALEELDYPKALGLLESLHARSPDRADVAYALARAYRRSDRNEDFRLMLAHARQIGCPEHEIQRQIQLNRLQAGGVQDFSTYQGVFEQNLAVEQLVELYEALARGFICTLRFDEAQVVLKAWMSLKPKHAEPHLLMAEIHERRQCRRSARDELATVLKLAPRHTTAMSRLGDNLLQAGDFDCAHEVFFRLKELDCSSPQAVYGVAFAQVGIANERGDHNSALSALESALQHSLPREYRAILLCELGSVLFNKGDNDAALHVLQEAYELTPGNPGIGNLLGSVLRSLGRHEMADAAFADAKKLRDATQRLSYLIEQIQISPNDIQMRIEATHLAHGLGREADSVQLATNTLIIDPTNQEAHRFLMEYYESHENRRRAAFHRSQAYCSEN